MNYFIKEVNKIRMLCFSNEAQIDIAVNTRKYINANFEEEIRLDQLAHLQHTSKFHLIRLFKRYYGITPHQYLIGKRMEEAKRLLKKGNSISDTCYKVGFESINSFSNLFKTKTGKSPSEYRKAIFDKFD